MTIHRVNRVRIELSQPTSEAARQEQSEAAAWAGSVLPGLLEEALSGFTASDQVILIDTLTLDIPSKPWLVSRHYWLWVVRSQLGKTGNRGKPGSVIIEEWIQYLEKGYLSPGNVFDSLAAYEQFIAGNLEVLAPEIRRRFRSGLPGPNALARMLYVHEADFLYAIFRVISGLDKPVAEIVLQKLRRTLLEQPDMLTSRWMELSGIRNIRGAQVHREAPGHTEQHQRAAGEDKKDERAQPEDRMVVSGEMYIANAGLILLHPYLNRFFETLGFTEKGAFTGKEQRHLAVHTLRYLAGNNTLSEKNLLFEKILCGIAPEEVLIPPDELPAYIRDECRQLLYDVIGNWPALKNSSPEALQEGFLQRPGIIKPDGEAIRLSVEKRSADVLLGRLPWGLSVSGLPWLNKLIYIDWA